MKVSVYRTPAGNFYYLPKKKLEDVTFALEWSSKDIRIMCAAFPFSPNGHFVRMDNDDFAYAASAKAALALAERFFAEAAAS